MKRVVRRVPYMLYILGGTLLFLLGLSVWWPLLMVLTGSLMGSSEVMQRLAPALMSAKGFASWSLLPQFPTLRPYVELLLDTPQFFVLFWNTVKMSGAILIGQLLIGVPAAWGFARYSFPLKRTLFLLYIALMLLPFHVTMVSSFLVLDTLRLLNTQLGIVLPAVFSTFPVFILYRFFRAIPHEVLEAATLDGASAVQCFLKIGVPLGGSGVAAAMTLSFFEYWNMVEQPLTFLSDQTLWPLSLYLPSISAERLGLTLAASVIALIPPMLVFWFGQSYLEEGIRVTGGKGR